MWVWPGPFAAQPAPPTPAQWQTREAALAGAHVFRRDTFDAGAVDFTADPNSRLINTQLTTCTFLPTAVAGTTPKFDCRLDGGEKIKVKYGWTREIPVEVAATRLLDALGFGADRMSRVAVLRCFGCVVSPFHVRGLAQILHLGDVFDQHLPYDHAIDFVNVAVERKLKGQTVEAGSVKGWDFSELSKIDPPHGGSSVAAVDAFRLIEVFLNHWDNKAGNQRLLCEGDQPAPCEHPLAMVQDTGSDFGPLKLNLDKWRKRRIWSDEATCGVSMKGLPYAGATFPDARISEGGRRLIAGRLSQLTRDQIRGLFAAAGFREIDAWVSAFQEKVQQIVQARCS